MISSMKMNGHILAHLMENIKDSGRLHFFILYIIITDYGRITKFFGKIILIYL